MVLTALALVPVVALVAGVGSPGCRRRCGSPSSAHSWRAWPLRRPWRATPARVLTRTSRWCHSPLTSWRPAYGSAASARWWSSAGSSWRRLGSADRVQLVRQLLPRFGRVAVGGVIVVVATGVVNSFGALDSVSDLWQVTYGRVLLIKIGLLTLALVLAARHRWAVPRRLAAPSSGPATVTSFTRSSVIETALLAARLRWPPVWWRWCPLVRWPWPPTAPWISNSGWGPTRRRCSSTRAGWEPTKSTSPSSTSRAWRPAKSRR